MGVAIRKWRATFSIFFQETIAYKASMFIWLLTDLVIAVTMPLVWAKASAAQAGPIAGFTTSDFVLYYLCLLLLGCFITSHIMWDLAMEIKEGNFSSVLVKPMNFMTYTFFRNLSWRVIRASFFVPIFLILLVLYRGYLTDARVFLGWQFWLSVALGHLVSFTFVYMMAMLALFVQEAMSIFELYYVPMLFLSGQLFPIAVLPEWAQTLAKFFPFYFTTGAPTEILIGRIPVDAMGGVLLTQIAWIGGALVAGQLLWRHGLKHYTGVGM